jgi:hypothetical protein
MSTLHLVKGGSSLFLNGTLGSGGGGRWGGGEGDEGGPPGLGSVAISENLCRVNDRPLFLKRRWCARAKPSRRGPVVPREFDRVIVPRPARQRTDGAR